MADGSQGGMSGVLFEAGKALSNSGKQAAKTVFQDATSQITGSTPKAQSSGGSVPKSPFPAPGAMPNLDSLGGLPGLFEKNALGKQNGLAQQQQAQQQQALAQMAQQNKAADDAKIASLTQKLHNETYYNKIAQSGGSLAQERQQKEQQDVTEAEQRRQAKEQQLTEPLLPGKIGGMLGKLMKRPTRSSTHETPKDNG